jgi:hypothetical protein
MLSSGNLSSFTNERKLTKSLALPEASSLVTVVSIRRCKSGHFLLEQLLSKIGDWNE